MDYGLIGRLRGIQDGKVLAYWNPQPPRSVYLGYFLQVLVVVDVQQLLPKGHGLEGSLAVASDMLLFEESLLRTPLRQFLQGRFAAQEVQRSGRAGDVLSKWVQTSIACKAAEQSAIFH